MFAFALQAAERGLTLQQIVLDLPHDFAALVVYLVLGLFAAMTWYGSKPSAIERHRIRYDKLPLDVAAAHDVGPMPGERAATGSESSAYSGAGRPVRRPGKRRSRDAARIAWIG